MRLTTPCTLSLLAGKVLLKQASPRVNAAEMSILLDCLYCATLQLVEQQVHLCKRTSPDSRLAYMHIPFVAMSIKGSFHPSIAEVQANEMSSGKSCTIQ